MAWSSGFHGMSSAASIAIAHRGMGAAPAQLNGLLVFGCLATVAAATSYLNRHESKIAMLTFAASLGATGVYGLAEGAWPLGMLELAWAIQTMRRGLKSGRLRWKQRHPFASNFESRQSRYREISGSN